MAFKKLHLCDPRKLIRIGSNLNGITVALIHHDPSDILAKDLRKECKHILLVPIHGLLPISQDRHFAFKKPLDDEILDHGIILHLIHDQMADTAVFLLGLQTVFQIQNRIHILITKLSFFVLYLWKRRKSLLPQETIV